MRFLKKFRRLSSFQIILLGFAGVILLGALLLKLPFATKSGVSASFSDALFTSTSAVCVTGLIVHGTAAYWSLFGQIVILLLIQIGGMGVVTIAVAVAMISGRKIGLMQRNTMKESISAPAVGGIVRMTGFILKGVFLTELIGTLLLLPVFCADYGWYGVWLAFFHAVSAFCNAGFDLMETESLTSYAGNPLLNLVIMGLIVVGGIGFLVWDDIRKHKWRVGKYRLQSKVVLLVSGVLIGIPALYFFLTEFRALPVGERIWCSLFQAVTPRTAGFNTVDLTQISQPGLALLICLMLVGGSPGSTAGGMKTTTLAVLFASAFSVFGKREHTNLLGRRIEDETVKQAAAIFLIDTVLFLTGASVISAAEGLPLLPCLFETASAIGTVGLSLGITSSLSLLSRLILIVLMYIGRIGGLTLIYATFGSTRKNVSRLPLEKITVG